MIGDSPARTVISGFLGHSAIHFCAYCNCTSDNVDEVDSSSWTLRNGAEVREQALIWKATRKQEDRTELEKENGVRWTSLHRLPYWDPVKHSVLGFMHNWLEGVLEHHLRTLWGIGRKAIDKKKVDEDNEGEKAEKWEQSEVEESQDELGALSDSNSSDDDEDNLEEEDFYTPEPPPDDLMGGDDDTILEDEVTITQDMPVADNSFDDLNDDDYLNISATIFTLPKNHLADIRECIRKVNLPTWVGRPPATLGEASHGSLRANDYLILFSAILPLIVPEILLMADDAKGKGKERESAEARERQIAEEAVRRVHLDNFHHLVVCTNIVCSFTTSNDAADRYTHHYKEYRQGIQRLFPKWISKPNHHYAMHNGDVLKYWGPLPSLSEFPGERLIGMLQNIKTNKKYREYSGLTLDPTLTPT